MKLGFDTIKEITVGAARICREGESIAFFKMTERQLEVYRTSFERFYNNACNTTGVRLDFWTDSDFFAFLPTSRGKYEAKLDGRLVLFGVQEADAECRFDLPKDGVMHRVTLYLPCHGVGGRLGYVELSDGACWKRATFDTKMLFIGDSITQGWNSEWDTGSYALLVSDHFNAESMVWGVGGACYEPETVGCVDDFAPDTVIVAYGTNDAGREDILSVLEEKCRGTYEKIKTYYPNARVVVITPIWRLDQEKPRAYGHVSLVSDCIAKTAKEFGFPVIDGLTLIPHAARLFVDNVHPNDLGFAYYAHNLIKALESL